MRRNIYTGVMLGAAMLAAVSGTAIAAAQQPQNAATQKTIQGTAAADSVADEMQLQEKTIYGTILKINKAKMELQKATVIWQTDEEAADLKTDSEKELKADLETETMKWKLAEETVVVKFDKDTKFLKQVSKEAADKDGVEATDKDGTGQKDQNKQVKSESIESELIKIEDITEDSVVSVTLKEDGSSVAAEVLVLADVTDNMMNEKNNSEADAAKDASEVNSVKEERKAK